MEVGELTPDPPYFTRVRNWTRNKFKVVQAKDFQPQIIVGVETVYLGTNPSVFQGLIQCQSHICAAVLDAGHLFRFINPMDSFKASTGLQQYPLNKSGKRSGTRKPAIQAAVKQRYQLEDPTEHICDAIAIAEALIFKNEHQ